MRRTALILAGAAVFDLGVMAVAAKAQESSRPSPGTAVADPGRAPNRDHIDQDAQFACANGQHIRDRPGACRAAPSDPSGPAAQSTAVDMFLKIEGLNTVQACTARRGQVVRHEGSQQCRLPAPTGQGDRQDFRIEGHIGVAGDTGGASARSAGPGATAGDSDYYKYGEALNFTKIDVDYTARTCIAQRGEVVTREGVQQCALPGPAPARARERSPGASAVPRE